MKSFRFRSLLTSEGWMDDAVVQVDHRGRIVSVGTNAEGPVTRIEGYALPGFQNAHSHAFQYAMAGRAERQEGTPPDNFWSWRNTMYRLALHISPEQLEAIATMLYSEMLRHGYTAVAEFHYLHHDTNGKPYVQRAEMGQRLIAAAQRAGIRITLIPMCYMNGGFDRSANVDQRRFLSMHLDDYFHLLEASSEAVANYSRARLGHGVHSLRAVAPENVIRLAGELPRDRPFHLHIAEQLREVEACKSYHGQRPVEWLLEHTDIDGRFHLVHATHLNDAELRGIAGSGATVVLCPSTEANLGDGLFRLRDYQAAGGHWCIGTDSHVGLSPMEELRWLDYGQRLISHRRDTFHRTDRPDSAFNAIATAWYGGRAAMGEHASDFFAAGNPLDAVVYNADAPLLSNVPADHRCNVLLYASDNRHLIGTLVDGRWVVKQGRHIHGEAIRDQFIKYVTH